MANLRRRDPTYVQKLDDASVFDAIKTGITKYQKLPTEVIRKHYRALFNHARRESFCQRRIKLNSISDITWVAQCFNELKKFVQTHPGYKKDSTRRFQYETIAWTLLSIDKYKHKEDSRWFWNEALRLQDSIDEERDENLLTPEQLENFVPYPDLLKMQQKWHKAWLLEPKSKKINLYHLILALNTLIPPIRKNYHEMEFWRKKTPPPEDDTNYLWEKYPSRWTMVINYDKVENKRKSKGFGRQEFEIEDEIEGVTQGKLLNDIINKSLIYYPRTYVLTGVRTTDAHMGGTSYDTALETIFNKHVRQNLIRKAYVNHWYGKSSLGVKKRISFRMRHSVQVAEQSYFKINIPKSNKKHDDDDDDDHDDDYEPPMPRPPRPPVRKPEVKKEYFNPAAYAKAYREKHPEKIKAQRADYYQKNKDRVLRNKVLWHLNVSQTTKQPTKKSIEKYNLKYNDQTKRWE
jgi:ribosomal protein L17